MKHSLIKTLLIAGIVYSPWIVSAQTKDATSAGTRPQGETERPRSDNQPNRMRNNEALFDRLDTDKNGSISREEFAKLAELRGRRDQPRREGSTQEARERNATPPNTTPPALKEESKKEKEIIPGEVDNQQQRRELRNETGTTGTTGGTGSSASSAAESGSATSGTGKRPE